MEEWKDINGYGGDYQISSLGRVKSLKYGREMIRKNSVGRGGYLHVRLSYNNIITTLQIHKLVAIHFLDHIIRYIYRRIRSI